MLRVTALAGTGAYSTLVECSAVLRRIVAMLAEIFMIRLETAKRTLQEAVPSISSHFVPIAATGELRFKERRERPAEAVQ